MDINIDTTEYWPLSDAKHDVSKFQEFIEHQWGFLLKGSPHKYYYDQNKGWCDQYGCYYDSNCTPAGWINLSKDGQKYKLFNMDRELVIADTNIYYSTDKYQATGMPTTSLKEFQQLKKIEQDNIVCTLKQFQQQLQLKEEKLIVNKDQPNQKNKNTSMRSKSAQKVNIHHHKMEQQQIHTQAQQAQKPLRERKSRLDQVTNVVDKGNDKQNIGEYAMVDNYFILTLIRQQPDLSDETIKDYIVKNTNIDRKSILKVLNNEIHISTQEIAYRIFQTLSKLSQENEIVNIGL